MPNQRKVQLLLWTYFWLLIFEGALRKWIFPGLSNPLLVIRDPVCILAIALGWRFLRRSPWWGWVVGIWSIVAVAVVLALLVGHGDLLTALYGARIFCLHFPLVFLFPLVFDRDDVWTFAKALLLVCIPMTVLISFQYSLPQSHFLNLAPGGEEGGGLLERSASPAHLAHFPSRTGFPLFTLLLQLPSPLGSQPFPGSAAAGFGRVPPR